MFQFSLFTPRTFHLGGTPSLRGLGLVHIVIECHHISSRIRLCFQQFTMFAFLKLFFPETNRCHQTEFPRQVSHNFCLKLGPSESRGAGETLTSPDFGISVNPISTKGRHIRPSAFSTHPPRFSDLPTALNQVWDQKQSLS